MTKAEAQRFTHSAVYRVVRNAQPMTLTEFFNTKIADTLPKGKLPSGWSKFWWESIATEIQMAVMARREYAMGFDAKWLEKAKQKMVGSITQNTLAAN